MNRREVIMLLGGAAAAWPSVAQAQQRPNKISRVGFLGLRGTVISDIGYAAFIDELRRLGFTEGQNLHSPYSSKVGMFARHKSASLNVSPYYVRKYPPALMYRLLWPRPSREPGQIVPSLSIQIVLA